MPEYGTMPNQENGPRKAFSVRRFVAGLCIFVMTTLGIAILVLSVIDVDDDDLTEHPVNVPPDQPVEKIFTKGIVTADAAPCAAVGSDILAAGGTAVDAAVAALFCNGVVHSHSMGIGGGFLMTVYDSKTGHVHTLNARESAPAITSPLMFGNDSSLAFKGPLSIAIPGEIDGYFKARERFGNKSISWRSIIQPTIDMCRQGIPVTKTMAETIRDFEFENDELKSIFTDPNTGEVLQEGQTYTRPQLAQTLEKLGAAGWNISQVFYSGEVGHNLAQDIADLGGLLSLEDLSGYSATWSQSVCSTLKSNNFTVCSVPPPGSGAVLISIIKILDNYSDFKDDVLFYHRLVEAFKFAYGKRTLLGDPSDSQFQDLIEETVSMITSDEWARSISEKIKDNETYADIDMYGGQFSLPDDEGTAHLTVVSDTGDAVAVTSTINQEFGSNLVSKSTGIILNDEMDDFSFPGFINGFDLPPSPSNYAKPGKRPMSSMAPTVIFDENEKVWMALGAAGGSRITTSVASVVAQQMYRNKNLKESVGEPRLHHQLSPNQISHQTEFDPEILEGLRKKGHKLYDRGSAGSSMNGVRVTDLGLDGVADYRKSSGVDGL